VPALVVVVLSSMFSVAAEASLGNEVDDDLDPFDESTDRFGVPMSVHWTEVVVLLLLGGAIGYMGFLFLHSMGIW
jgi:hypothetical protein